MEMDMEEEDGSEVNDDDHNHNNYRDSSGQRGPTQPSYAPQTLPVSLSLPVTQVCTPGTLCTQDKGTHVVQVCSKVVDPDATSQTDNTAPSGTFALNSSSKFLINAMTEEDYRHTYWPNLEKAIEHLLKQNPVDYISISYEQTYSYVYKCVCQQHSELLYKDLMLKITTYLQQISSDLQTSAPENFVENFDHALTRYTAALQCIVPVFVYMSKFYIETKLNRDLRDDLMKLFTHHVAEKHVKTLLPLLIEAHSMSFQVRPSTMASVVKGLYSLQPEWAQLAPDLFSSFIPQMNPPALESQLSDYAAYDQKLQMELSKNGFPRGDQSRKRASEEIAVITCDLPP